MQSLCVTTRLVSRAIRHGFATLIDPNARPKPHFISVACGFPKDLRTKHKPGRFGEDAFFMAQTHAADVIGEYYVWIHDSAMQKY